MPASAIAVAEEQLERVLDVHPTVSKLTADSAITNEDDKMTARPDVSNLLLAVGLNEDNTAPNISLALAQKPVSGDALHNSNQRQSDGELHPNS